MKISMKLDASAFEAKTKKQIRNLAYSTVQAINDTAKQVQEAVRKDMEKRFNIRSDKTKKFLFQRIKISQFADVNKNKPYAEISIDIKNKARLLLPLYETGGERKPFFGKQMAVPITSTAREGSINKPVADDFRWDKMKIKKYKTKAREIIKYKTKLNGVITKYKPKERKTQLKGRQRTFVMKGRLWQRIGSGRRDIRAIYHFSKPFRLRKRLRFVDISKETYQKQFQENFYRRFYKLSQ